MGVMSLGDSRPSNRGSAWDALDPGPLRAARGPLLRVSRVLPVYPADAQQVPERRKRVAPDRDLRFRRVEPQNRNFRDLESVALRQIQDLHVVGDPLHLRVPEEAAGDVASEELESALRVGDAPDGKQTHEQVPRLPEDAPVEGLADAHEAVVASAG